LLFGRASLAEHEHHHCLILSVITNVRTKTVAYLAIAFTVINTFMESHSVVSMKSPDHARCPATGALGKAVHTFMDQLNSIVESSTSERVRDGAFCVFCDLIIVFDPDKLEVSPSHNVTDPSTSPGLTQLYVGGLCCLKVQLDAEHIG
jgi:hypothetical protein